MTDGEIRALAFTDDQIRALEVQREEIRAELARAGGMACLYATALKQIQDMDFALTPEGARDLYSGPGRFVSAWLVAYNAFAVSGPCPHKRKVERLKLL